MGGAALRRPAGPRQQQSRSEQDTAGDQDDRGGQSGEDPGGMAGGAAENPLGARHGFPP